MGAYRLSKRLLFGILLTSTIVGIIFIVKLENNYKSEYLHQKLISETKFLVNTNAFKIPRTPIWPEFIKKGWNGSKVNKCRGKKALAQLNDSDQMLRILPEYSNLSCCLREVHRIDKDDQKVRLSNCTEIVDNIVDVSEKEILVVKCGDHVNYEANIPMKSNVQRKIKKWKNIKLEDLPLNVLMIGMDAVSRSHAYRSIPRTLDLLKQMGFKDFRGYHSVSPFTYNNFIGFLMGLEMKAVREGCAPNWNSSLDSCPLIWKDFSLNDYVTMFMEDGPSCFEWGGQSGFHSLPTDYYLHPIFLALSKRGTWKSGFKECTSPDTLPKFMLRYTSRFIQKFESTPFFSFTWLNYPSHDGPHLRRFENDTFQFFDSLQSIPGFLKRTVIIFLSDHGDRTSYSDSKKGIEAYIERSLPPLLIRFPELLKERHPELEFEQNVNFLTSPVDLHQTFLHILALEGFNVNATPVDKRQSLLTRIESDANRTCETLHIWEASCVCNVYAEDENDQLLNNPILRRKIVGILKGRLNRIVESSKYKNICARWNTKDNWISNMQVIKKTTNHSDVHVLFSADSVLSENPRGIASFEARVRIAHDTPDNSTGSIDFFGSELIGRISRVNVYGNQSWCVDGDKDLKPFCLCKSSVPKWLSTVTTKSRVPGKRKRIRKRKRT